MMKRDGTASPVTTGAHDGEQGGVAMSRNSAWNKKKAVRTGSGETRLALAPVSPWTHTLVLSGELNHRSAHVLEAEIDRVCEEGVTGIIVDLRGLTDIDSTGVAVIAFRSGLCRRRGYDFTLIPGSAAIHSAFEQAGMLELLPFEADELAASEP
jgi:anti-anti-sigma factor